MAKFHVLILIMQRCYWIDHQSGLFNTVRDLNVRELRANAVTITK